MTDDYLARIGNLIRDARKHRGWTQQQLADVLFDKLQLPVLKRTGTSRAPSTAVEVLEELALNHDIPRQILEWRQLMKLKGTYIDALPQLGVGLAEKYNTPSARWLRMEHTVLPGEPELGEHIVAWPGKWPRGAKSPVKPAPVRPAASAKRRAGA